MALRYSLDLEKEAELIYGTDDKVHPAVNYLFNRANNVNIGGKIKKLTVNTCSLDHKSAIYLYQKYGFTPVKYKDLEKTV